MGEVVPKLTVSRVLGVGEVASPELVEAVRKAVPNLKGTTQYVKNKGWM